jgi:hypothetical protein
LSSHLGVYTHTAWDTQKQQTRGKEGEREAAKSAPLLPCCRHLAVRGDKRCKGDENRLQTDVSKKVDTLVPKKESVTKVTGKTKPSV